MVSPQQFSSYLRKPYDLDVTAEANLRIILQQYPYFSNAHLLLARSLHNQKSPAFDDALKQASMYAGERSLLYKLVNIEEKEAAPIERTFETVTPVTAPVEEPQTVEETKEETLAATTYQETEQAATPEPQIETEETIATPVAEAVTDTIEEADEFELPVAIEEPEAVAENTTEEVKTSEEVPFEEAENTHLHQEEAAPILNEEDKVKSAYEEIFGSNEAKEEDITTDFESFDDEDDFVLHLDDNESKETAKEEITADYTLQEDKAKTTEEEFEAEIGDRLDNDGDGIIVPANTDNTPEEEFELGVADAIANTQPEKDDTEKPVEEETAEYTGNKAFEPANSTDADIIIPVPSDDDDEEEFELDIDSIAYVESEQDAEIVKMMEQSIDETEEKPAFETFEESTLDEPIAFKLEPRTETINPAPIEEEAEQEEPIAAVVEEKPAQENESVLLNHDTFFEWLAQLQKLQADDQPTEKKNEVSQQPQTVEKQEPTISSPIEAQAVESPQPIEEITPATPKKTSTVDDIINRFISINPTISRPKAEFYNPTIKSKESDTERDDLATETLAKIYSDQQLNEKAIDVYQKLIKLYPNKAEQYKTAIAELESGD